MKRIVLVALVATLAACQQESTTPTVGVSIGSPSLTVVTTPCEFVSSGSPNVLSLQNDCQTSQSILLTTGTTLNGNGHTITAVDPEGGHFVGGVIANASAATDVHVTNVVITASGLSNACNAGGDRLRGVLFDGASGSVTYTTVRGLRQDNSGCQEGNSIEVRNFGASPTTVSVEIANNTISDFMKTGIVVNGDVNGNVHNNTIGPSANQAYLAANSIQFGFGSTGIVKANKVAGNQWCGSADAATGVLLYDVSGVNVTQNVFTGNANVGIYLWGNGNVVNNNKVYDDNSIADCQGDYGIYNDPTDGRGNNTFTNNKVGGFTTPYAIGDIGNNKSNPNK